MTGDGVRSQQSTEIADHRFEKGDIRILGGVLNGLHEARNEKERTYGWQRKVAMTDHRQRTRVLVLEPHE